MSNTNRRDFFKALGKKDDAKSIKINNEKENDDPLFKKYSRKTSGRVKPKNNIALRIAPNASTLAPYTTPWTISEATHLLRRTTHGATKAQTDALLELSPDAAIESLFNYPLAPALPSATPLNYYENSGSPPSSTNDLLGVGLGGDWTKTCFLSRSDEINRNSNNRNRSVRYWSTGVYLNDGDSIREKMTIFWYHFIPISINEVQNSSSYNCPNFCHDYLALLRNSATGNFKTLIKEIGKSHAMLFYLGGQTSTKTVPNENFARELFELFTLGKEQNSADNKYTEEDIKAASKIFSGWRINNELVAYPIPVAFNATYHNQEDKQFSMNFDNEKINNQTLANGANEYDIFFEMLFTKQAVTISKYICRRLYRFFVYYEIDAPTETNIITPLADLLVSGNWEILPVVKKLLKSQHFFDQINRGVMIKSPFDFVIGTFRALKINSKPTAGLNDYLNQYFVWNHIGDIMNNIEQNIINVPDVAGWKAYYQAPTFYQNWINANTIQKREAFITSIINGYTRNTARIQFDLIEYIKQWPEATIQNPDFLIEAIIKQLLPLDIDSTFKTDTLKVASLLGNQTTNDYWTRAWTDYTAAPNDANKKKLVTDRLKELFNGILKLAEYQLM